MELDHFELTFDGSTIDQLKLKNEDIINLLKRDKDYRYCSLCERCYTKKKIKLHWVNRKHLNYHYNTTSSDSVST